MPLSERWEKQKLLVLAVEFSLALCLIYSLLSLAGYFGLSFYVLANRGMVEHHAITTRPYCRNSCCRRSSCTVDAQKKAINEKANKNYLFPFFSFKKSALIAVIRHLFFYI